MSKLTKILTEWINTPPSRACQECGASLARRRSDTRYCTDACRMRHNRRQQKPPNIGKTLGLPKSCPICGTHITSDRATYCGATCRKKAWRRAS